MICKIVSIKDSSRSKEYICKFIDEISINFFEKTARLNEHSFLFGTIAYCNALNNLI